MGDSLLFENSNDLWSKKRKSLSSSFYKDKLLGYFELMKLEASEYAGKIHDEFVQKNKPLDIVEEIMQAHIKILLRCAFGINIDDCQLDFEEDGKFRKLRIGKYMLKTFQFSFERFFCAQIIFFPSSYRWFLRKFDRDTRRNARRLRGFFQEIIDEPASTPQM